MASTVIKEFLVALGFKTDESGLKNFTNGLKRATKTVFALAAAIEATATTVAAAVAKYSSNLEALYFAAQRTGSSATALKALDLAARNLGAHAGEAQEAVEGLASAMRTNPGNIGLLQGLLVRLGYTLKVNADGSIDAADSLIKLSEVFKRMPFFQAAQFAQQLGISEHTLYQLTRGNLVDEYRKALTELGRGGFNQAAEHAHQFMVQLRDLEAQIEVFIVQVGDAIEQKLKFNLEDVRRWLEKNGPALAQRFAEAAKQLIDWSIKIGEKVAWIIDVLKQWDEETGGLSTRLIALAALLKVSGGFSIIGGILSLAGALGVVSSAAVATAAAIASVVTAWNSLVRLRQGGDASNWISDSVNWLGSKMSGQKGWSVGGWFYDIFHRGQQALQFFQDRGWSAAQAAGIVANLQAESGLHSGAEGDNGKAFGLAQWHPDRQLDFKRLFGKDIHDSSFMDQLEFIDAELRNRPEFGAALLRATQNSADAARVFSQFYERPAGGVAEANRRAGIAANISQHNEININGAIDPRSSGQAVHDVLKRQNSELARNFANAVQ